MSKRTESDSKEYCLNDMWISSKETPQRIVSQNAQVITRKTLSIIENIEEHKLHRIGYEQQNLFIHRKDTRPYPTSNTRREEGINISIQLNRTVTVINSSNR